MTETQTKRSYKATFILDTRNYQEPVETLVEKLKSTISAVDGTVTNVEDLGSQSFARVTDRNFPVGIYVSIDFDGATTSPQALKEKLRLDKTVNRIFVESN
tara:strand:- start:50555 stop:50857 length:303 start_codon:yes stop_codon:yes gene_type:complete